MAERKTKAQVPGGEIIDGFEVDIDESSEKWSEYKLSDGTTLRLKQVVLSIVRPVGLFDPEGNPMYIVKAQPVLSMVSVPEGLRKKVS
jgi:hypothetical protein